MDGDRLAEQLKGRVRQMDGDSRSRNEDGSAGLGSLLGPAQPTSTAAGLGCLVFGGKAQFLAEPRLARRREIESGQRVPGVSQLQPLPRAGSTPNHSCPETPNSGGLPCLWARLKGTRCSRSWPQRSIIPLTPSMLRGAGLSRAPSSWHAGLCLTGVLLG